MRKATLLVTADTCVSIVGTFKHVTFSTLGTLLTITNGCKSATDWRSRIDGNVSIAAVWIGAIASKKMSAGRNTMRGGVMGKVARMITSRTAAMAEKLLANGDLVGVVNIAAAVTEGADTC